MYKKAHHTFSPFPRHAFLSTPISVPLERVSLDEFPQFIRGQVRKGTWNSTNRRNGVP